MTTLTNVKDCKHGKYRFIGMQRYPGNKLPDLKLYNCIYCGGTLSHLTLIKLYKERTP